MSDEQGAAKHDTTLYVHYCEHPDCKKWGAFGFAVGKAQPNWFSIEHRSTGWPFNKASPSVGKDR